MIVLVRHAEPVAPTDRRYEQNDRPLADAGRRDADRLADQLSAEPVAAIYSSPYPRCGRIVAASHGNLVALALHAIAPDQVDFAFWAAMPTPAVYVLGGDGSVSGPGFGD